MLPYAGFGICKLSNVASHPPPNSSFSDILSVCVSVVLASHILNFFLVSFFTGYAYEERSEVSPDHRLLAYTMYNKDNDFFTLSVRDLATGSLCSKPQADRVSNLAWAMGGQALLYTVTNTNKRPYRLVASHFHQNRAFIGLIFL